MDKTKLIVFGALLLSAAGSAVWGPGLLRKEKPPAPLQPKPKQIGRMVHIPGGVFRMGNELSNDADEQPVHDVFVDSFRMDEHEVTNRQFARFVAQTNYVTTAEQRGWSHVFDWDRQEWARRDGADWRHPGGPDTSLDGRDDYPVVHVSWYDAAAYARWSGKQLPTEAQWEYAARAGLRDANFPWGSEELIDGNYQANYRQHGQPAGADGFVTLAPAKSFPPNRFGIHDVSGNVWEWCRDWYDADYYQVCPAENPSGPDDGQTCVQRGGSFLSPENYRFGHYVSTRSSRRPEETSQHVGFRCVRPIRSRTARHDLPRSSRY